MEFIKKDLLYRFLSGNSLFPEDEILYHGLKSFLVLFIEQDLYFFFFIHKDVFTVIAQKPEGKISSIHIKDFISLFEYFFEEIARHGTTFFLENTIKIADERVLHRF